jgi:hypothetical protein
LLWDVESGEVLRSFFRGDAAPAITKIMEGESVLVFDTDIEVRS